MTNKIEVIDNPKTIQYSGKLIKIYGKTESDIFQLETYKTMKYLFIRFDEAKELADILPEFIKKIEEEK